MVNPGEVPIKAVMFVEPKVLTDSDQKGTWPGAGAKRSPAVDDAPPAERHDLTHSVASMERGKPVVLPLGKRAARRVDRAAGRGWGRKRMPSCNEADRGWAARRHHPTAKAGRLPPGVGARESSVNRRRERRRYVSGVQCSCLCGFRHRQNGSRPCRSNVQVDPKTNGATVRRKRCRRTAESCLIVSRRCIVQGLSRMMGNYQVRFLGEGVAATPLSYPAPPCEPPTRQAERRCSSMADGFTLASCPISSRTASTRPALLTALRTTTATVTAPPSDRERSRT
jgi:hypothetical protein